MAICVELMRGEPVRTVASIEEVKQICSREDVKRKIDLYRSTSDKARAAAVKGSLPGFVFQCSSFKEHEWIDSNNVNHGIAAWRHQEHGVLNGLCMIDIDHVENPKGLYQDFIDKGLMDWGPVFAFITPSGEGLKLVLKTDVNKGNLASHQKAFGEAFNVEVDKKTKDSSRLSFTPKADDILFISEELCTYENQAFIDKYTGTYSDGSSDADLFDATGSREAKPSAADGYELALIRQGKELPTDQTLEQRTYDGMPVKDLINEYFDGKAPADGTRHDTLLRFVSDVRHIVEKNEESVRYFTLRMPWVQDFIREGEKFEQTLRDGLAYKYTTHMPVKFKKAIEKLAVHQSVSTNPNTVTMNSVNAAFERFGEQIEAMFEDFPCLQEICYNLERGSYPAALFAGGCLYGTLATRTWYYFFHQPELMRRLNYEIFIIADPTSGKSVFSTLYKLILSPIIAQDKVYNSAINKYKKATKQRQTSTKEQRKDPLVYPESKTRIHGSRTANNIFIEDMVNNVEIINDEPLHLHLFTFDAELDAAGQASKGGQWIDKSIFELKAFHNEEDNQQYRNLDSVTGPFDVFWNFIYTGTPFSLDKKCTQRNFGSGLPTRLAVLPFCSNKFKMVPFSKLTKVNIKRNETLKEWAFKLDQAKGELPLWPLVEVTYKWQEELTKIAEQTNDEATVCLIRRVPYYGINVSAPFILMRHWKEWQEKGTFKIDQKDKNLCSVILEIQFYAQKLYFGKFAENYCMERQTDTTEKAPTYMNTRTINILRMMPETFTRTELIEKAGITKEYARVITHRWTSEGLIIKTSSVNYTYEKTYNGKCL